MENLKNLNLKAKVAILVAFLVFMAALIAWVVSQCNKKTQVRQKETMLLPNQGGSGDKPIFHLQEENVFSQSTKPYLSNVTKQGPSDFIQQLKKEQKRRGIAAQEDSNKPSLELSDAQS